MQIEAEIEIERGDSETIDVALRGEFCRGSLDSYYRMGHCGHILTTEEIERAE